MTTETRREIDRLCELRRRALDVGLGEGEDARLVRLLDKKIADAYARDAQRRE